MGQGGGLGQFADLRGELGKIMPHYGVILTSTRSYIFKKLCFKSFHINLFCFKSVLEKARQ